jgi:uncharacterized protein (DUF1697 family)
MFPHIASGNVIFKSDKKGNDVKTQIERVIPDSFKLNDGFIKVLVLDHKQFEAIVENKPKGFGEQPEKYHSDAIFLMGIDSALVMPAFNPRDGVDQVWAGNGVIYSQRLSSQRTKSRLIKIMETPFYKSMTIRNWNTTIKLLEILRRMDTDNGD